MGNKIDVTAVFSRRKAKGHVYVDFFDLLPEEILENILLRLIEEPLSNKDFTNCRLVCKNWDARISSNSRLWKVACQKLGLNVKKAPEVDYYKGIYLRTRKRFQQMKDGSQFTHVESLALQCFEPVVYCRDGIVAIGNDKSIHILEVEPNLRVVLTADLVGCRHVACIHFDDSYLVIGTDEGYAITFEMPTMRKLYTVSYSDNISCITFNTDIDLLVTASYKNVTFWCLSSGTVHFTSHHRTSFVRTLHLISTPDLPNGCDYTLLCVGSCSCYRFRFNSRQVADSDETDAVALYEFDPDYYATLGGCVTYPFLYFELGLKGPCVSTLVRCDTESGSLEEKGQFGYGALMTPVGVGRKYALILERRGNFTKKVIIYDLATESEFASFDIPYEHFMEFCLGNASWLDGFDGFNDKGVLLVIKSDGGTCYTVRWNAMIAKLT